VAYTGKSIKNILATKQNGITFYLS